MDTNGGSKFSISYVQFGKTRVIFYKIAGRNFIKNTRSDGRVELRFWYIKNFWKTNCSSKFSILFFKSKISIFDLKKSLEVTVG